MNYLQKYLKYKQKYLELLNKINGGMSNWDFNSNLVTQIKRQDNNGNFYLENINILDLPEEMKKRKYTLDDEINTIKIEIIELYNLLNIENNKHEYELDKNINNITTIKNAILKLLKHYNEEILDKQLLEDLGKFKNESSFYMKIKNDIKKELIDEFNILSNDEKEQILNDIKNNFLFDEKNLYNKKTKDEQTTFLMDKYIINRYIENKSLKYKQGNISEELIIKNPILIQCFTGDFGEIKNSKDISAFRDDATKIIKEETGLNDSELVSILQYYPIDGISNNTLYELKSFYKDVFNISISEYKKSKLFGYTNNLDIIIGNKIFKGSITYDFKYDYYGASEPILKIKNIVITMNGKIFDKNNKIIKSVNIDKLEMLKDNITGYDYIWVEFNSNGTFIKNALNKKYFNDNFTEYKKDIVSEINKLLNEHYDYDYIIKMSRNDFKQKIIEKRDIIKFKNYINDLDDLQIITKEEVKYLISQISTYKNNPESIPIKYVKSIKEIFKQDYLFEDEEYKLNDIIYLQNKLLFYNPILKNEYIKNGLIISKIEDYNILPSTQLDYLTKKIDEGKVYDLIIHLNR